MAQSILYYPTIDIEDSVWLRNAILYWDEVHSIVPHEGFFRQSAEIEWLKELGVYKPIMTHDLNHVFTDKNFQKEISYMEKAILSKIGDDKAEGEVRNSEYLQSMIHYNKLPLDIRSRLCEENLVSEDDGWCSVRGDVLLKYMGILARYAAEHSTTDTVIGTDWNKNLKLSFGSGYSQKEDFCFSLIFERAMPSPSRETSLEEILNFKAKRGEEFLALRMKIRDLEDRVARIEDVKEIKPIIQEFRESWQREILSITRLMNEEKIDFWLGNAKSLIAPKSLSIFSSLKEHYDNIPTWLVGAGLTTRGLIGLGRVYVDHRKRRGKILEKSNFSYLYDGISENILRRGDFMDKI